METLGIVETLRGQGTFIRNKPEMLEEIRREMVEGIMKGFFNDMKSLGYEDEEIIDLINKWRIEVREEDK